LIDHFLEKGADPEKVLFYIEKFNDPKIFAEYIIKLSDKLDDDNFKTALRDLMKQKPSEEVIALLSTNPRYQKSLDVIDTNRAPASVISTQQEDESSLEMH